EDAEDRGLDEQVDEVPRREEVTVERLEEHRDQQQAPDDRQDADLSGPDPRERRAEIFGDRAGDQLGRDGELCATLRRCGELLRLLDRTGGRRRFVDLGHRQASVEGRGSAARVDTPLVIRSTTICRSSSAGGRTETILPR